MEEFRDKFIEAAGELINDLEGTLLDAAEGQAKQQTIEEAYRAMHTLKGISGMYGFENIADLTHDLEDIYSLVSQDDLALDAGLIDLTLSSIDLIKKILKEGGLENQATQIRFKEMRLAIKDFLPVAYRSFDKKTTKQTEDPEHSPPATYVINFSPEQQCLVRGVNVLSIFDELQELGQLLSFYNLNDLPTLNDLNPSNCYLRWQLLLYTEASLDDLKDVFMFVPDSYQINRLSTVNLLNEADFMQQVRSLAHLHLPVEMDSLLDLASDYQEDKNTDESEGTSNSVDSRQTELPKQATKDKFEKVISQTTRIKVEAGKLDELMNLVSDLTIKQAELNLIAQDVKHSKLRSLSEEIGKLSKQLRDNTFSVRLVPLESLMLQFRRLVRDLSIELGKEVDFVTEGMETEIDKNILDSLANPLVHLLRNAIDHGIELPEVRKKNGKPKRGRLSLKAYHAEAHIIISISDDGQGLDINRIRQKAIDQKLIAEDSHLTTQDLLDLIFLPGFSTVKQATNVSGRGVGMDVVKTRIASLRGSVGVESQPGVGTTFTIRLPLILAIIDTLLVEVGGELFLFPLSATDACHTITTEELKTHRHHIELNGELTPYISLREHFDCSGKAPEKQRVVTVQTQKSSLAILVDQIIGQHQAVLKPLGDIFSSLDFMLGASILANGDMALVIDPDKLVLSRQSN